jgi:hypothetical protein
MTDRNATEAAIIRSCMYEAARQRGRVWARLYNRWRDELRKIENKERNELSNASN